MNELQQLAAFASGLAWEDIPAPVKSAAKASILDTLSVALGGVSYPMFQHIKEVYLKTEAVSYTHLTLPTTSRV